LVEQEDANCDGYFWFREGHQEDHSLKINSPDEILPKDFGF